MFVYAQTKISEGYAQSELDKVGQLCPSLPAQIYPSLTIDTFSTF